MKITRAGARPGSSRRMRRRIVMWSLPKAVPQVATAVPTPDRWAAMTSVYPSTTTAVRSVEIAFLARSSP